MELQIKNQSEKPFLGRKELVLKGESETTPSKEQLREEIAKMVNSPKEMVVVKRVKQQFGMHSIEVESYVYESENTLKRFEHKKKKKAEEAKK